MATSTTTNDNSLYETYRRGDLERVRELLPTMTCKEINDQLSDGNTPLHCACEGHHKNIVSLLHNEEGLCSRRRLNRKGLTAIESTNSAEISELFSHSSTPIYHSLSENDPTFSLQPTSLTTQTTKTLSEKIPDIPDDWVKGHIKDTDATDGRFLIALLNSSFIFKKQLLKRIERQAKEDFENLIDEFFKERPDTSETFRKEFEEYKRSNNTKSLLKIYTYATNFCKVLQKKTSAYTTLIYLRPNELSERTFTEGNTYRGALISRRDIEAYKWASSCKNYLLETRTFQSTSKNKEVAEIYRKTQPTSDELVVLFIYIFPEKCDTAIDIHDLSQFSDEEEVLVLPFTLFKVSKIIENCATGGCEIFLTYIPLPKTSLLSAWWNLKN
jgi:hypothetical protein